MVLFEVLDEIKFKIHHGRIGGITFEGYLHSKLDRSCAQKDSHDKET
jgi:hypothetical protein